MAGTPLDRIPFATCIYVYIYIYIYIPLMVGTPLARIPFATCSTSLARSFANLLGSPLGLYLTN